MAPAALEIVFRERSEKCSILFGDNLLDRLPLGMFSGASSLAIVSDDVVAKLYADRLCDRLSRQSNTHVIVMRHGERHKNVVTVLEVAKRMSDIGLDRKSAVIALGGGVVGDLTGFVASIFKRGIKYFQAPTTILSQVDSSIGGKCGVDSDWGKNQIGTFYQPSGIFIDGSVLDTLPEGEIINGLAEIVKSSIVGDRSMFDEIDSAPEVYFSVQKLKSLIRRTCEIKAKVVEADEREKNLRKILNYGHTVGHAIESSSGYRLSHGKSIILGMICEGWIANKLGIFDDGEFFRQKNLLLKIRNHYRISATLDRKRILSFAVLDKKNEKGMIKMSLPEKLGRMHSGDDGGFSTPVSEELFLRSLNCLKKELADASD